MSAYAAKRGTGWCPTHPGALLREDILPALGMTKVQVANALGISRQHLYDILSEKKPVSAETAATWERPSATVRKSGFGCRRLSTPRTQGAPSM